MPRSDDRSLQPVTDANIEDFFKTEEIRMKDYPNPQGPDEGEDPGDESEWLEVPKYNTVEEMRDWHTAKMTTTLMWLGVICIVVLVLAGLARAVGWIIGL